MIGRVLGHFRVVEKIGQGGMGEVYRATDAKLGRDVALKVLPVETASSPERLERFQREAKALAAVDHAGIVTVFSVEEADGVHFLTMQLVDGRPLDRIASGSGLRVTELVDIGAGLAAALAAAHDKGIVHRDLKPANVMITRDGSVKVLDFGLAQVNRWHAGPAEGSELPTELLTQEGVVMGTVPYMSPEQVSGRVVDHRSDIFSMGVILYELACGRRPFRSDNTAGLMSAILRDHPAPVTDVRSGIPGELQELIEACLRKDPADRIQTAREVGTALKELVRPSGAMDASPVPSDSACDEPPSIAVLPFANMSADPENQFFSDGLSEEIINALTRLPGLRVIARTSAFRFRGEQDLREVGEALGVETVLEGSVRKAGNRIRITAQLIGAADHSNIWSERFDRELDDVFAIQDEISAAIVDKLHLSLSSGVTAKRESANVDVEAFELLLEVRHHFSQFTPQAAGRALDCLERIHALEPDYPDALTLHAFHHVAVAYMFDDPREPLLQAQALAERALELDPLHGEAHATAAIAAALVDRNWTEAERLFRRAIELAPASARVHELYGLVSLLPGGRLNESLAELDRAVELDPLSALYAGNRGRVLTCSRRFEEAEKSCRRGLVIDPGQLLAQVELIYALTFQGRFDEAIGIGRRAVEAHGPSKAPLNALLLALALAGRQDEARRLLDETAAAGGGPYRTPLTPALVHAASSDMDAAFEQALRAVDENEPLMMYLEVHPMFDDLRGDDRFPELLRRMNLPEND